MPSKIKSQQQHYYDAVRSAAEVNLLFLQFVKEGMTKPQLRRNIARRPSLWGRFSGWLDKLPED